MTMGSNFSGSFWRWHAALGENTRGASRDGPMTKRAARTAEEEKESAEMNLTHHTGVRLAHGECPRNGVSGPTR
jgi:hypothetical protein